MSLDPRDLSRLALLLDIDGTLIEIAPTPKEIVVPPGLANTLRQTSERVGGALALVSGRPIREIDAIFAPLSLPAIGGHGAEMRPVAGGAIIAGHSTGLDAEFKDRLKNIAAGHPGVLVEDKGYSLALHYRLAPKQGLGLIHDVKHAYEAWGDQSIEMLTGEAVIELKFAGFNKGTAVRQLMTYPPFQGRAPIIIGDDRTDEDAFAVAGDYDGYAVSVGRKIPGIDHHFNSPAEVRHWLERLAGGVAVAS